jgi:hypothetical protein
MEQQSSDQPVSSVGAALGIRMVLAEEHEDGDPWRLRNYPNQAAYSIVTNFGQNLPFFVTKTVSSSVTAPVPLFNTENALCVSALGIVGANNLNHDFKIEYNEVWNLNLERELSRSTTLSLAYIGSRTVHADAQPCSTSLCPVLERSRNAAPFRR